MPTVYPTHDLVQPVGSAPEPARIGWCFSAFGLHIMSEVGVIGSEHGRSTPDTHPVLMLQSPNELSVADRPIRDSDTLVIERHTYAGDLVMRVRRLDDGRYTVEAPNHGTFSVTPDGATIFFEQLREPDWLWHRPLVAQVLPVAAALRGFELFHASAVQLRGRAIGFVADSGTGKTSLATHLNVRGAPLLTDDVLSLELRGGDVIAHPGVSVANIASDQLDGLAPEVRARLGAELGSSDKIHLVVSNMATAPMPLAALCFLERSEQIRELEFKPADPPDPWSLLKATFTPHVVTPSRLSRQLEVCADIAAHVPVFNLRAPLGLTAAELACEVETWFDRTLA